MIMSAGPVNAITGLSVIATLLQAVAPVDGDVVEKISRLGVTTLLAIAVFVLWRELQKSKETARLDMKEKDALLLANYKLMADSQAASKAVTEKMSDTLEAIKETVERMETVRQQLGHHIKE